ncbi:YnhF family membrane protein [Ferrimonas gelatinilytica]
MSDNLRYALYTTVFALGVIVLLAVTAVTFA